VAELHFQPLEPIGCEGLLESADACRIVVFVEDDDLYEVADICKLRHINAAEQIDDSGLIEFIRSSTCQRHHRLAVHGIHFPALQEFFLDVSDCQAGNDSDHLLEH
jgi:hypothetical protein